MVFCILKDSADTGGGAQTVGVFACLPSERKLYVLGYTVGRNQPVLLRFCDLGSGVEFCGGTTGIEL